MSEPGKGPLHTARRRPPQSVHKSAAPRIVPGIWLAAAPFSAHAQGAGDAPVAGTTGAADPLAGLRDIELPPAPGWWPPAPGWWLLAAAAAGLGLLIFRRWQRWYAARRPWRAARAALAALEQRAAEAGDPHALGGELSDLLRRYALVRWPRTQVAKLSGDAWRTFLAETGAPVFSGEVGSLLTSDRYRRPATGDSANSQTGERLVQAIAAGRDWVDLHRPGSGPIGLG